MAMTTDEASAILSEIGPFSHLDKDKLCKVIELGEIRTIKKGEYIFKERETPEELYIFLSGQAEIYLKDNGAHRLAAVQEKGRVSGKLPYSRMKTTPGYGIVTIDADLFFLHEKNYRKLEDIDYQIMQNLVSLMVDRTRETVRREQQNEKLISLGKLSAGLAHELNNPASALRRTAQELKKHLSQTPDSFKKVIKIRMEEEAIDHINDAFFKIASEITPNCLPLSQRSILEDELTDWMENHGFEDPFELAESLAEYGVTLEYMEMIGEKVREEDLEPVIRWINNVLTTEKMVAEIEEAAGRIGDLIGSIKSYTHMDRDKSEEVCNIKEGISSTLTMLKHELKVKNVEVKKNFQDKPLWVRGYPSELNQVWTNLIQNAIDALPDKGGMLELVLESRSDGQIVCIIDNGEGIPEEIQNRIFDPFFTTKGIGKGTGLGLDITRKIIQSHKGDINVKSKPGRTEFRIRFPNPESST